MKEKKTHYSSKPRDWKKIRSPNGSSSLLQKYPYFQLIELLGEKKEHCSALSIFLDTMLHM